MLIIYNAGKYFHDRASRKLSLLYVFIDPFRHFFSLLLTSSFMVQNQTLNPSLLYTQRSKTGCMNEQKDTYFGMNNGSANKVFDTHNEEEISKILNG